MGIDEDLINQCRLEEIVCWSSLKCTQFG